MIYPILTKIGRNLLYAGRTVEVKAPGLAAVGCQGDNESQVALLTTSKTSTCSKTRLRSRTCFQEMIQDCSNIFVPREHLNLTCQKQTLLHERFIETLQFFDV